MISIHNINGLADFFRNDSGTTAAAAEKLVRKGQDFRDLILRACKAEGGHGQLARDFCQRAKCPRSLFHRYTVAVKVIDIFGNDTMALVPANVG
jgi:hypothetical protein